MSQSSNDRLQFSINESVWLREDAPAEEILSMALEPDITVEENWNDVTIKGFLRLTGEYKPADVENVSEQHTAPFRTIDEIMDTGNGTDKLEHRFPIDITIPSDRVPNLEDLFVVIDSFDYELSEHRHIQLQADISITGLANKQPVTNRTEKPKAAAPVQKPKAKPAEPVKAPEPVQKPAAKAEPAQKPEKKVEKPAKLEKSAAKKTPTKKAADQKPESKKEPTKKAAAKKETVNQGTAKKAAANKDTQPAKAAKKPAKKAEASASKSKRGSDDVFQSGGDLSADFDEMPTDRLSDEAAETFQYDAFRKPEDDPSDTGTPAIAFNRMDPEAQETPESARSEVPASAEPAAPSAPPLGSELATPPEDVQEKPTVTEGAQQKDAPEGKEKAAPDPTSLYLTKVLAGDEEEQKTRMKICIVQAGDSIETISERYHVPVTSLLRKNARTTGDIEPGELLYIPKSSKAVKDES
ncbi:LysM peptidoglycan-binding domain-containing protein [Sporolactobacillus terrae]|uniref:LysM peptidoglycan-binding domain-containing protein n=1 Tax=Sporolactobacillus terrae TaxID=269673 RepID=UPI0011195BB1|nr:LysM peptidoglycan-binding domain-containing protein [Sporolactobacillus terrae]